MGADSAEMIAYRNSRPAKRMGAGALIRDIQGRLLLVQPTYKSGWEVPGGAVDADESPRGACEREVAEELGLQLTVGRLLCMEWQGPEPDRTESLMFIYDGGLLDKQTITLAASELSSYALVSTDDLDQYVVPRLSRRLRAAVLAIEGGHLVELEHGHLVDTASVVLR